MKATEAVKSALTQQRKGRKATVPHSQFCPIRYDLRSYWVKWATATCSLATVVGRLELGFTIPPYARQYLTSQVCGTIVLENLTHIRRRVQQRHGPQSRRLHSWSFAQLQQFTRYKAENQGQRVVLVDPRHTSQTCNRCGYTSRRNRPSQAVFCCRGCGYQLNADLSAARNIAAKYHLASIGRPLAGGPPSNGLSSQSTSVD
ncbi:MAG TPA: transposase [Chloroflexia bacterium]|nr:transposase [Chloroflexia bacterium]